MFQDFYFLTYLPFLKFSFNPSILTPFIYPFTSSLFITLRYYILLTAVPVGLYVQVYPIGFSTGWRYTHYTLNHLLNYPPTLLHMSLYISRTRLRLPSTNLTQKTASEYCITNGSPIGLASNNTCSHHKTTNSVIQPDFKERRVSPWDKSL